MEPSDFVLSDVHLNKNLPKKKKKASDQGESFITRFMFQHSHLTCPNHEDQSLRTDEDGDLDLPRPEYDYDVILIKHNLLTKLEDVGTQVWPACLFLCDFILDNKNIFESKIVVELGAGVGLLSIVVGTLSKKIICTDYLEAALELCRINFNLNKDLLQKVECNSTVLKLDWTKSLKDLDNQWSEDDIACLNQTEIILASDVIYSQCVTDAFFEMVIRIINLNKKDHIDVFISLEKRLNFTIEDKDIACPAYEHFVNWLQELCTLNYKHASNHLFTCCRIKDVRQYFVYDRSKYLELWKLSSDRTVKI